MQCDIELTVVGTGGAGLKRTRDIWIQTRCRGCWANAMFNAVDEWTTDERLTEAVFFRSEFEIREFRERSVFRSALSCLQPVFLLRLLDSRKRYTRQLFSLSWKANENSNRGSRQLSKTLINDRINLIRNSTRGGSAKFDLQLSWQTLGRDGSLVPPLTNQWDNLVGRPKSCTNQRVSDRVHRRVRGWRLSLNVCWLV